MARLFPIPQPPLRPTDRDVVLDLQPRMDPVYENGSYSHDLTYREPLYSPFAPDDAEWSAALLAARNPS